jgi:hypothetical protein
MKINTKALITTAAMAGLMAGAATRVQAAKIDVSKTATTLSNPGRMDDTGDKGKHDCKGKNSCKGTGGCQGSDNGCKGKNSCKGKGGCNTNKPAE